MDVDNLFILFESIKIRKSSAHIDADKPGHFHFPIWPSAENAAEPALSILPKAAIGPPIRHLTADGNTILNTLERMFMRSVSFGEVAPK